jgi:hypothetical protein
MADKPSNIESLSSSVSSSREGETPQQLEEKNDECLPVSHSVSAENQPPQLDRWQPISTAPIGVTEVLLCWQDGVSAPMFKTGYNLGDGRRWQDTHQWLHNEHSWPTHWMPLPPPPECVDCEAILRRDPPFGVALALPNPPEADKPNNSSSSSVSSSREGETPLRCAACGASTDSPLTARNISAYPSCAACGAVSSISKREGETLAAPVYSDYWQCASCGSLLHSPTTGRADGVQCWKCNGQPVVIGEQKPTVWKPVAKPQGAHARAIAARNALRPFLREGSDAALAELDIALTLLMSVPLETPAAPVEPRGLRPAICDPEHYPEDAAYAQPIKQRTGPLCSIHPDYREPCLMCKRAGIGEAPRLPAGAP